MFKNLPIKFFALFLATIFWIFVVSLENTVVEVAAPLQMQVFNQAQDLALSSPLPEVKLTVRTGDSVIARRLTANDFEAYIDLRNVGAGQRRVPVSVTSRNAQVSVVKISPHEVDIVLEPVREKRVNLTIEVNGHPATGFDIGSTKISQTAVNVHGAESLLRKIVKAVAVVNLDGKEEANVSRTPQIVLYDQDDKTIEGVEIDSQDLEATVTIIEVEATREVGVRPRFSGSVAGVVKSVETSPSIVSIIASREILDSVPALPTENIDLTGISQSFEKKVKLVLPVGVKLADKITRDVTVKVEVEASQDAGSVVPPAPPVPPLPLPIAN